MACSCTLKISFLKGVQPFWTPLPYRTNSQGNLLLNKLQHILKYFTRIICKVYCCMCLWNKTLFCFGVVNCCFLLFFDFFTLSSSELADALSYILCLWQRRGMHKFVERINLQMFRSMTFHVFRYWTVISGQTK